MPWTRADVDWVAARLLPAVLDINRDLQRYRRVTRRLRALHLELMKIRITEQVFFLGQQRHPGEVLDVEVGPFRTEPQPGGLRRIPQFVEMAEEIKHEPQVVAPTEMAPVPAAIVPPPATFAEATAAVMAPKPPGSPKANPFAARIRALTARRAKFQDEMAVILGTSEATMAQIETDGPEIIKKAHQAATDELTAIQDLGSSLHALDAGNGS